MFSLNVFNVTLYCCTAFFKRGAFQQNFINKLHNSFTVLSREIINCFVQYAHDDFERSDYKLPDEEPSLETSIFRISFRERNVKTNCI